MGSKKSHQPLLAGTARAFNSRRDPFALLRSESSAWLNAAPFAAFALVIVAEYLTPNIRITPSLLTIALASFTLFLRPRAILFWSLALFIPVLVSLLLLPTNGVMEDPAVVVLRCLAFIVVAAMAFGLAATKDNSRKQVADLVALLDALRTPVIVSDVDGSILYSNRPCHDALERDLEMMPGPNFLKLFRSQSGDLAFQEEYLERFDGRNNEAILPLVIDSHEEKKLFAATSSPLSIDGRAFLVWQMTLEVEASPETRRSSRR